MGSPRVWLLNFEADHELARRGNFTPGRELARQIAILVRRHAQRVLRPGDLMLEAESPPDAALAGFEGRAWCPTPSALAMLGRVGLHVAPAPPLEVLRRANDRGFNAELGQTLPGALFSHDLEQLTRRLGDRGPTGQWLCKRAFGVAGRGQLRLRSGELGESARAWLAASLRLGGVQLEPLVEIEREFASHGILTAGGELELGEPCILECDSQGAWVDTRPAREDEITPRERGELLASARAVAGALGSTAYFGPFGVDAFRWRDEEGRVHLQSRSEINARYTLGWRVSFPEH